MKYLIIPDIHLKHDRVERIISNEGADQIIFLGDYFDDFGDSVETTLNTARWLKQSLTYPNRIHLIGNHDAHYMFPTRYYDCSGWEYDKMVAIKNELTISDFKQLKLYHYDESLNVLYTHAGLTQTLVNNRWKGGTVLEWFKNECKNAIDESWIGIKANYLLKAGKSRGGLEKSGGITWCDLREFVPVKNLNQIFGHTPITIPYEIRTDSTYNICLDTHLNHYLIIDNSVRYIKEYAQL